MAVGEHVNMLSVAAKPYDFVFPRGKTALLVIDMQRDFLQQDGFGAAQSTDLASVQASIAPTKELLILCRSLGLAVVHTREGHDPELATCPSSKLYRNKPCRAPDSLSIGDKGPMGRLLIRGEYGHDFVDDLAPLPGEVVIDKPGKGAFWNTPLMDELRARSITHLIVCGVTTECCFTTTIREANDRGFECCGVKEATAGYVDDFKAPSLNMIDFAGGLFGFTASLGAFRGLKPSYTNGIDTSDWNGDLSISALKKFYSAGGSVVSVAQKLYDRIEAYQTVDPAVWIHLESRENVVKAAQALDEKHASIESRPPLFGVPFSVKDSLDVAGVETTTACPPLAFMASENAAVCQKAFDAGALFLGKTNLDQFATGLSGCRSPYGTPHSVYSPQYISGGSSSGSAVAVGAELCTFSIATDTAGSGRVPAGFNSVIGFKPTRGTISTVGLVPACPSLDCIAITAKTVVDTREVWHHLRSYDERDPYAKWAVTRPKPVHSLGSEVAAFRFATPPANVLEQCSPVYQKLFRSAIDTLTTIGGRQSKGDWTPFEEAGKLLYDGTFVSERLATLPDNWVATNKDNLHPVVHQLLSNVEARQSTAVQAYRDIMAKAKYTRDAEHVFRDGEGGIDILVVPTTPIHWTIEELQQDPIVRNAFLGTFTHFGNILDLCAVAVPAAEYGLDAEKNLVKDSTTKSTWDLPFGVTLLGMSGTDGEVLEVARRFQDTVGVFR